MEPVKKVGLINEFSKVTEYMSNSHKSILFPTQHLQIFGNVISYSRVKNVKYLRDKSNKYIQDLFTENHNTAEKNLKRPK